jgi:phage protein U
MRNIDDAFGTDALQAQFEAVDLTESVGAVYSETTSLNRQTPILQWVNGESDTITFQGRVYAIYAQDAPRVQNEIKRLKKWVVRDSKLGRPPTISFSSGDGHVQMDCVIERISNIRYDAPQKDGSLRGASFTMSLRKYVQPTSFPPHESRYHAVKRRDYYESLAQREYKKPLLGDVLRKRNPDKANLATGDVVKLPSLDAMRKEVVEPTSIPLATAFGKKDTPQRRRLKEMFDLRSVPFVSHVIRE